MANSNRKKWVKGILIGTAIFLLVFVASALILPLIFKKQILDAVKKAANEQLTAKIDFKDISLSLLWTFPNFSFNMYNFTVTGKEEFEGLKLADVKDFGLRLNLWKVISGNYEVNRIVIDKPKFYVKVLKNGKANYNITKPDSLAKKSESTDFKLKLQYYDIRNADITYDDAPNSTFLKIVNMNHSGKGDLTASTYDFFTNTMIDQISLNYGGIGYLNKAKLDARINIAVDLNKMSFKLKDNQVKLNALELKAEGGIEMPASDIKINALKISTSSTSFAAVLSMIPAAYTKDFSNVKTKGSFSLSADINGVYNAKSYPAFNLNLKVANAEFKYPDLPMPVTNINVDMALKSPSSDLDKMLLNISKFTMQLGSNPFEAALSLSTPMSDPNIDTKVKGKINLAELAKAFPMEGVSKLNGLLEANLEAKTKVSYVTKKEYDKVNMKGLLSISGFDYVSKGTPTVNIKQMKMEFTPNNVILDNCELLIGKSDISANGKLDNILTYFSGDKIMTGNLTVRSNLLDLNDMMKSMSGSETKTDPKSATSMADTTTASSENQIFDKWDFSADFQCKKMKYDVYEINELEAKGNFSPSRAKLENFKMLIGKVDLQADGNLENVFGYLFNNQEIKGELNLKSNYMNLNQFMSESGKATEPQPQAVTTDPSAVKSEYEPIAVPANINFHLTGAFATMIYESYNLKNVKADIRIRDQKAEIINLSCNAFGGFIALNGSYNTKNINSPAFSLGYDLQKIDFQEFAKGVPMIAYFAPALKAVFGKFSSKFKMDAILDKNLYPKMESINADGLLQTFDATLKGLSPVKGLSDKLKIKELESFTLANTTNFFTIEKGKFTIKPFAFKHSGIDMTFGGSHGLDQKMNYNLKMRVPKALLDKAGLGQAASEGMKLLSGQASKLGIKVEEAEFLNIGVDIGGTTLKPVFTPKILGAEGKSGKSLGDQVKDNLKDEAEKLKKEAEEKLKEEAEKLRKDAEAKARAEAERLAKEIEAKAKAEADRLVKQAKDNAEIKRIKDSVEAAAKAAKDKLLKDKLKDIPNPFKRK
jgi:F0F1-type ATP synthase membrane subunit b/b'